MLEIRMGEKVWRLTNDGYCAYCEAYRAMWLSECDNPVHYMTKADLDKLAPQS